MAKSQGQTLRIVPTKKQEEAWNALEAPDMHFVYFGGGAGGGKSWLGCEWLLTNCYLYPGSKWFIGREELKRLMQSTFVTWLKVCSFHKIPKDWDLNGQYNFIHFKNGSRIDLLDLKHLPTDPLYERFGSLEYTGGWIDEAGEVDYMAVDVLKTRVGRHENDKYGISRKTLYTFNPNKGWLYRMVYEPWKSGTLPVDQIFIQALYNDNPYTSKDYGDTLAQITDIPTKQRLMFGDWHYESSPDALMDYDSIIDVFTNAVPTSMEKYITVDVARFGSDKTVIGFWRGYELQEIHTYHKQALNVTAQCIEDFARTKQVPYSHIVIDEDGVGGGVVDLLSGVRGFMGNSIPKNNSTTGKPDNYQNLRTQCYYKLAEMINNHQLFIRCDDQKMKGEIIQELEQVKSRDNDRDGKRKIVAKDDIKALIGRSPDYSDMIMQRMLFEFSAPTKLSIKTFIPNNPYAGKPRASNEIIGLASQHGSIRT